MQFNVEDISNLKKRLHVEIPSETVSQKLNEAYNEIKKTAKIKGFRQGKTPRPVLERIYRKNVHEDVSTKLIQESFADVLKQFGFSVVGDPSIDPKDLVPGSPFKYDITIEILPRLKDIDYKALQLTRHTYRVTDEQVESQLRMLQRTVTEKRPISEPRQAMEGDFVVIDYEGLKEGKPYAPTQRTENFSYKIGSRMIHENFDHQLAGMMPDEEKEISVTFPDHHPNPQLKGARIDFQVRLREIREEVLYDLDDAFAKKLGDYETLDQLKHEIVKNLEEGFQKRVEHELNEQIFSRLISQNDFEAPEALITLELEHILSDIEHSVDFHNKTMEELGFSKEKLAEKYRGTAEKQVKRHLLLKKIIDQENLDLTDEELNEGYEKMAAALKNPVGSIREFYQHYPDKLEVFKLSLLEKKAVNLIIKNSEIVDKSPEDTPSENTDSAENAASDEKTA
jgi:trigger factor